MNEARDPNLEILLMRAEQAISASDNVQAKAAAKRVFERLASRVGRETVTPQSRPPGYRWLDAAFSDMAAGASPMPEIASAFAALSPRLTWTTRKGADPTNQPFFDGHANAYIIGEGGIEERNDVMVGATVMAPGITYPDHDHPPEEVYLAFTDGEWWNAKMEWTAPGPGGVIYNPHGILHAMRSGAKPFLALWLLPID